MQADVSQIGRSTQTFGWRLLSELSNDERNLCISPGSISLCLQLALSGAYGNTAAQMLRTLGIIASSPQELLDDGRKLMNQLKTRTANVAWEGPGASVQFALANSIWIDSSLTLNSNYASAVEKSYDATCVSLEFGDPQALRAINSWVDERTEHKIPVIIERLSPVDLMVLINCAYLKAGWSQPFPRERTCESNFHLSNGQTVQVPTMSHDSIWLSYYADETVQIAELAYTEPRFTMYIVLPAENVEVRSYVRTLTGSRWESLRGQLRSHAGRFAIPRFRAESSLGLKHILQRMGMVDPFTGSADFRNMLAGDMPPAFFIGDVLHKAYIAIDEEGTEAAAATALTMWATGISVPPRPFEMIVDRPFIYAVADNLSGSMLFLGVMHDPRTQ